MIVACDDLAKAIAAYAANGYRLERISPADDPRVAIVEKDGARVRLERTKKSKPTGDWVEGRAGMRYRDLIPDRFSGRLIASHIRIDEGGPVSDYVHFHDVRFQLIYCLRGWVRVVYEDQGAPFVLEAGDAVLQPPKIRHRVLESSAGLEVIEVTAPSLHDTFADHAMKLPTKKGDWRRQWDGQRFNRHVAKGATWRPWKSFEVRDFGVTQATTGRASADVWRGAFELAAPFPHEMSFFFVLSGSVKIGARALAVGEATVVPQATRTSIVGEAELLYVAV